MNLKSHTHIFTKLSLIFLLATLQCGRLNALSNNAKNDPFPIYTSLDPHHFLLTQEKFELKDMPMEKKKYDCCCISLSPFGQNSCDVYSNPCLSTELMNLGDLEGRWGMLGLLFGDIPKCAKLPDTLATAKQALFTTAGDAPLGDSYACAIDPKQMSGFFTIPLEYRKRGMRLEFSGQFSHDFGIKVQAGFADICQIATFKNLTPDPFEGCCEVESTVTTPNVNKYLMCKLSTIAREICLDINPFHETYLEDLRAYLYWRRAYLMNEDRENWENFLLIPFVMFGGSISLEKDRDYNKAFSLSFGNNNHHSIGATAGLNIDFHETIEIGAEFGLTHFFAHDFCSFRVPTSVYQSGIYPFSTAVTRKPGFNWHFGAKLTAYRFMGDLSFYAQYIGVTHQKDSIILKRCDSAFKPEILEQRSCWKAHRANFGFNYDISPYISLGMVWQVPLAQTNTYKSIGLLFSINACY